MQLALLRLSYPTIGADAVVVAIDANLRGETYLGRLTRAELHNCLPRKRAWRNAATAIRWLGCTQKLVAKSARGRDAHDRRSYQVMHALILAQGHRTRLAQDSKNCISVSPAPPRNDGVITGLGGAGSSRG